ncbi:MAG: DUF2141 domain-containing protein [Litorimonas sp.]
MSNANSTLRPYWKFIRTACVVSLGAGSLASTAIASEGDEPLSAIGIERGLELYERDASDPCVPGTQQIRVIVNNVQAEGILKLELFGEKDFMKSSGKLRRIRVPADNGPMIVCIDVPEAGDYAVVGYHDRDGDRKLDKKWNFKPKEPYGLSNNPEIKSLRLPKWEETRFAVPATGWDIVINLVDLD